MLERLVKTNKLVYSRGQQIRFKHIFNANSLTVITLLTYGLMVFLQLRPVQAGGGEVENYQAVRVAQQTTISTSFVPVTGTANTGTTASTNGWVDSSNLTAGDKYLVMVWAEVDGNNNSVAAKLQVKHGSTVFGSSTHREETDRTSSIYKTPYFWFTVWTAVASEDLEIEFANGFSTYEARVEDVTMVVMHAEDLISNNELIYDEDDYTGSPTLTTTYTPKSTVTWTPDNNNDDWWVMGYTQADIQTTTDAYQMRLDIDSGTIRSESIVDGEDANDTPVRPIGWTDQYTNASHTIELEVKEEVDMQIGYSGLFALRLNRFEDFTTANDVGDSPNAMVTDEQWYDHVSIAVNPTATGDFLFVGGSVMDDNDGATHARIRNTTDSVSLTDEVGGWEHVAADRWPYSIASFEENVPTGSNTYVYQGENTAAITAESEDSWIVGFSMELASAFPGAGANVSEITQRDYIWENDNEDQSTSDSVDENGQMAAGSTALTDVKKGERLTLRTHIDNSGAGTLDTTDELGLFYDRSDGIWSKVESSALATTAAGSGCDDTAWTCLEIDTTDSVGEYSSLAIDPITGLPVIAYNENTGTELNITYYVGSGGTGCASAEWQCDVIESTLNPGVYTDLAFDSSGKAWIAFVETSGDDIMVAEYVGGGIGSGCDDTGWTCTTVAATNLLNYSSMAIDINGDPWIAFQDATGSDLVIANYVGSGGDCDTTYSGSDAWECTVVESTDTVDGFTDIAFDPDGDAWVSYSAGTADLYVAEYVGGGTGSGCDDTNWTCTAVWTTGSIRESSIAFAPDGIAWIAHADGGDDLNISTYNGAAGGDCDTTQSGSDFWNCEEIDTANADGDNVSLAFAPDGNAWISYFDTAGADLRYARYVGASGTGCTSSLWECVDIETTSSAGEYNSLAFDSSGGAWISHSEATGLDLELAYIDRGGEITVSPGIAGVSGDALSESHADMTSVTDTTNRDDGDCIGTGGIPAWSNGKWFDTENASGLSLAVGDTNLQCTEVAWTIDTSQAVEGTTYRFVVASNDGFVPDRGMWRGPVSITEYPTITIESETSTRYAKDYYPQYADCDDTAWSCGSIDGGTSNNGEFANIVFDSEGTAWVSYDEHSSNDMKVARYVGTGGTGCEGSVTDWTCYNIAVTGDNGKYSGIEAGPDGSIWVSWYDDYNTANSDLEGDLYVAKFVGSGGDCDTLKGGSDAWECTKIYAGGTGSHGRFSSIAVSPQGKPMIAYNGSGNWSIAEYVGGSAESSCDTATDWVCYDIATTDNQANGTDIEFDENGVAWSVQGNYTDGSVEIAQYVGSGGNCESSAVWECSVVDNDGGTNKSQQYPSLAFDSSNAPWVAFYEPQAADAYAAKYVGSGGDCSNAAWECYVVDTTAGRGKDSTLAFDSEGTATISYHGTSGEQDVFWAEYVGSGGSGCTDAAWTGCTAIDSTSAVSYQDGMSHAFDKSGTAWIVYADETGTDTLDIAKLKQSKRPLSVERITVTSKSAGSGDARYRLDDGRQPRSDGLGVCGSTSLSDEGYCGVVALDGQYDTVEAQIDETALYTFAQKYDVNTVAPSAIWIGETTQAPNTAGSNSDLVLEIYRAGSTNAWEELDRDSTSTDCDGTSCSVGGRAGGTVSDYYEADGADYWAYFRVYQEANGTSATTLKTDLVTFDQPSYDIKGYIWENDNEDEATGDSVDENTQLAAGDTALTEVRKGQRLTLRTQIENTSRGSFGTTEFSLFYDKSDGIWTKVEENAQVNPTTNAGCDDSNWHCEEVVTSTTSPIYNDTAVDPVTGQIWTAWHHTGTGELRTMTYVGVGGSGCDNDAYTCSVIDDSSVDVGEHASIAIDSNGKKWIAYHDETNEDLRIAEYVGTGGTGCKTGVTEWTCTIVDNAAPDDATAGSISIAIGPSNRPWIGYHDDGGNDLYVAEYVGGTGGSGCTSTAWNCEAVHTNSSIGVNVDIAVDGSGTPWVTYQDTTNADAWVARRDGGNSGCETGGDADWSCEKIDVTDSVGWNASIAIGVDGRPWISYRNATDGDLIVARRTAIGSGGTCDNAGFGGSDAWECTVVHADNDSDRTNIAIAPDGNPWVAYRDETATDLWVTQYVGSGGSGCEAGGSTAWTCTLVESTGGPGGNPSMVFDIRGNAWIFHHDLSTAQFEVSRMTRSGEIITSPGLSGVNGDVINESHVDMSTVTDTTNRDDADCISGSWSQGAWTDVEEATASIPANSCTELAWTIDTSQAVEGTTYRFITVAEDTASRNTGRFRGPEAIDQYATLGVTTDTGSRLSKGTIVGFSDCDDTDWGCLTLDSGSGIDTGDYSGIAIDNENAPWIAYRYTTGGDLYVAHYVGGGAGTGCDDSNWICEAVLVSTAGQYGNNISIGKDGTVWLATKGESDSLTVATYVGGGLGTGCSDADWTCTVLETTGSSGYYADIAISPTGVPWISYKDNGSSGELKVAHKELVSGQGIGCDNTTDWSCDSVDGIVANTGEYTSIAFTADGIPWVSYYDATGFDLRVANYVGFGGNCTSAAWDCEAVDVTNNVGEYTSIAIDGSGNPWVSYEYGEASDLRVAKYVGDGLQVTCSGGSSDWDCDSVDTGSVAHSTIAMDSNGEAWVAYQESTSLDLRVAHYVGSGGNCSDAGWDCGAVESTNSGGVNPSIVFDKNNIAWISHMDTGGDDSLELSKMHLPIADLSSDRIVPGKVNSRSGDFMYRLDPGSHPLSSQVICSATTNYEGYCGLRSGDGQYDSINAGIGERPAYGYSMRVSINSQIPTISWTGRTDLAPNTAGTAGDLQLEVYRFGTTNAWEALSSDTTASNCDTIDCTISGQPSGTTSEYFEADGSEYWVHIRVYQIEGTSAINFRVDSFDSYVTGGQLRGGQRFEGETRTPFRL